MTSFFDHAILHNIACGISEPLQYRIIVDDRNDLGPGGPNATCAFVVNVELLGALAVKMAQEMRGVINLVRCKREQAVEMIDVCVKGMDFDRMAQKGATKG